MLTHTLYCTVICITSQTHYILTLVKWSYNAYITPIQHLQPKPFKHHCGHFSSELGLNVFEWVHNAVLICLHPPIHSVTPPPVYTHTWSLANGVINYSVCFMKPQCNSPPNCWLCIGIHSGHWSHADSIFNYFRKALLCLESKLHHFTSATATVESWTPPHPHPHHLPQHGGHQLK